MTVIAIAIAKLIYIAPLTLTTIVQQRFTHTKKIQKNTTINKGNVNGCKRHEEDGLSDCA